LSDHVLMSMSPMYACPLSRKVFALNRPSGPPPPRLCSKPS
jgi:hypothetical protein